MTAAVPRQRGDITQGLTWIDRVDAAESAPEVLEVMRVYLAQISPAEVAVLPTACRPRKLFDADDLAEYALDLMRAACMAPDTSPLVAKLAAIFSHASTRIAEVEAVSNDAELDPS